MNTDINNNQLEQVTGGYESIGEMRIIKNQIKIEQQKLKQASALAHGFGFMPPELTKERNSLA